jgi:hypothetical protein
MLCRVAGRRAGLGSAACVGHARTALYCYLPDGTEHVFDLDDESSFRPPVSSSRSSIRKFFASSGSSPAPGQPARRSSAWIQPTCRTIEFANPTRLHGGSSCRLTISHSPRSRSDGTRREDRHVKFYEPRDNLQLLDAGTVFSELPRHHPCLSIFPGCALSGLRAVLRRERHGSRVGRSLTARTAGRTSECPPGEMDESEIGFPKIGRGPAKAGSLPSGDVS